MRIPLYWCNLISLSALVWCASMYAQQNKPGPAKEPESVVTDTDVAKEAS